MQHLARLLGTNGGTNCRSKQQMYGLRLVLTKLAAGDVRYKIDFVRTNCRQRKQGSDHHVILTFPMYSPHFLHVQEIKEDDGKVTNVPSFVRKYAGKALY